MNSPGFIDGRMSLMQTLHHALYSSQGGGTPELPSLAMKDAILDLSPYVWLHAQDIDTANTDQYDGGVKLWEDNTEAGNDSTQATEGNRPTVATSEINGHSDKKAVVFNGSSQYLDTGLNGAEFATALEFEIHLFFTMPDGQQAATGEFFGVQNVADTDIRCFFNVLTDGRVQFQIGNSSAFASARTTNVVLPNGPVTGYFRIRVDKGENQVSIFYSDVEDGAYIDITDALTLNASFPGDISSIASITNFSGNIFLGARNNVGGSTSLPSSFSAFDFLITPLLSDDEANLVANMLTSFKKQLPDSSDINTTDGEIAYIDHFGGEYKVIARRAHVDPPPSYYPSDLFTTADITTDNFVGYEENPVFDVGVTYTYFKSVFKKDGLYIGIYVTKPDVEGTPISQQEDIGIATSSDLITWTDLGVVLEHGEYSRIFPGPMQFSGGLYYLTVQVPESGEDLNDHYEIHLYSSPDLENWTFVKPLVENSGEDEGPMSSITPQSWIEKDGIWYLFFVDLFGGPGCSTVKVAASNSIAGEYTILGEVLFDLWAGHPITPGGGSGEETNINFFYVYPDSQSENYYAFYSIRDQSQALPPRQARRVQITF